MKSDDESFEADEALHEPAPRTSKDRIALWLTVLGLLAVAAWLAERLAN